MKIEVVGYLDDLSAERRVELTAELINRSQADLMLFPGWTLVNEAQAMDMEKTLTNPNVTAVFEAPNYEVPGIMEEENPALPNFLFVYEGGKIRPMHTHQVFADSGQLSSKRNRYCADKLVEELETRRKFTTHDKKSLVVICGENNILKNLQGEGNRVVFRFEDDKDLAERFRKAIAGADIILNPCHTKMGNQGKLARRREYFSADGRSYFTTCNFLPAQHDYNLLQYGYHDGRELTPVAADLSHPDYITRTYEI